MSKVWEFLNAEYRDLNCIAANRISDLQNIQMSDCAKTESEIFLELYSIWREVFNNLGKINLMDYLDNPHTLETFLALDCQKEYICIV